MSWIADCPSNIGVPFSVSRIPPAFALILAAN